MPRGSAAAWIPGRTTRGVEKFSSAGARQGYFVASSSLTTGNSALRAAYDVAVCPNGRAYVADTVLDKIVYYRLSDGRYQGAILDSRSLDVDEPAGLACGPSLVGSGSSLYLSGEDPGYLNEISYADNSRVREVTSLIDEPYGLDMRGSSVFVANKDDDNIVKVSGAGNSEVFSVEGRSNPIDDPRGVAVGPAYSAPSGARGAAGPEGPDNDEPEFTVTYNGTEFRGAVPIASPLDSLRVSATDPDGDPVSIAAESGHLLPPGSVTVSDHGNGTATVYVNSTGAAPGPYVVWVTASDDQGNSGTEPHGVTVQ